MRTFSTELFGRVFSRSSEDTTMQTKTERISRSELRVLFSDVFADEDWRDAVDRSNAVKTDKAA